MPPAAAVWSILIIPGKPTEVKRMHQHINRPLLATSGGGQPLRINLLPHRVTMNGGILLRSSFGWPEGSASRIGEKCPLTACARAGAQEGLCQNQRRTKMATMENSIFACCTGRRARRHGTKNKKGGIRISADFPSMRPAGGVQSKVMAAPVQRKSQQLMQT